MGKEFANRCISLILMLAFSLGMMCQYHHHDLHGNVYIGLSAVDDLALGDVDHVHSHCIHSHCTHERKSDSDRQCSLHIDQCPFSFADFDRLQVKTLQNNLFLPADKILVSDCPALIYIDYRRMVVAFLDDCVDLAASCLRAPPVA